MKEKRTAKKIVIIAVSAVALLAVLIVGIVLIRSGLNQQTYKESMRMAEKYVMAEQYEDAVVEYENAIEAAPKEEEGYLGLADVYLKQEKVSSARVTLEKGYTYTKAVAILEMLNGINDGSLLVNRFDQEQVKETQEKRGVFGWNTAFIQKMESYTYHDYSEEYGTWPDVIRVAKGEVKVVHKDLPATMFYSDTEKDDTVVNDSKNRPDETGMPEKIELDSLEYLFNNMVVPVSIDELQKISSSKIEPIVTKERTYVQLVTGDVIANIETDAEGNIVSVNAWNEILLPEANQNRNKKGILKGIVIDAMTGEGVQDAELLFEGQEDSKHQAEAMTAIDGAFSVELEADIYDVTISADGYVKETFEFEMEEDKNYSGEQFTISPELMAGSARIVLEWGAEPQDLDSYLYGDTDSGADVFVNYYNKQCTDGGDLIAELDVDDTNGYGPETVTLYDLNGVYRYTVVDYRVTGTLQHYGATVKVYLPNQSSPEVITIAPGAGVENIWDVFELDHGELKILNSAGDENRLRESDK